MRLLLNCCLASETLREHDKQTLEVHETIWSETCEDETLPEIQEIAGSGLESAANLLLKLCQLNEMEKLGKWTEIQRQIETEPETVSTSVNGILGASYEFWDDDEEEEDGPPIFCVEEQEWFDAFQNQLTMNLQ